MKFGDKRVVDCDEFGDHLVDVPGRRAVADGRPRDGGH